MTGSDRNAATPGAPGAHAPGEPSSHALAEPGARAPGEPLLQVEGLRVELFTDGRFVRPVDAVSFAIARGRTLGIVGASGAGKTLTALSLTGLTRLEGARVSGSVRFRGRELATLGEAELRRVRGRQIAFVFQDSISALHPLYRVGAQLAEAIRVHRRVSRAGAKARARELLSLVGIDRPQARAHQYPHELSGGQRQRVAIALALAGEPELLVADEPTTALDVTVQAQIVALLRALQRERELAILLISHDLGLVAELADEVCVMHAGRIVERGPLARVLAEPRDPHTRELLGAMPTLASPLTDRPRIALARPAAPGGGAR